MDKIYRTRIEPNLELIRDCRAAGGTAREVCERISVSQPTLRKYLRLAEAGEGEYGALKAAFEGKAPESAEPTPEMRVEQALYNACCGYTATVKKHYKLKQAEYDPVTGKKLREWEELREALDEVHVPAGIMAQKFYLMNRLPERWQVKLREDGGDELTGGVIVIPDILDDGGETAFGQ